MLASLTQIAVDIAINSSDLSWIGDRERRRCQLCVCVGSEGFEIFLIGLGESKRISRIFKVQQVILNELNVLKKGEFDRIVCRRREGGVMIQLCISFKNRRIVLFKNQLKIREDIISPI